jgi:glutamyl-tRNA synthetase
LRTALLAWLFARVAGGRFIVRIEDIDQYRIAAAPQTAQRQLDDLESLGIDWDGPVLRQSSRFDVYREYAAKLDTYQCFCSRREVAEATQAPHGDYRPYPGTCAHLMQAERDERRTQRKPAIRVRATGATFTVRDRFAGDVTRTVDDFVLIRNDGLPAYNLASVVDDGLQGVTQVCRGADLLDSAPRQAWLATQFGFPVPEYVHVGMAVNTAGERLAKRDGAITMRDLASLGGSGSHAALAVITDSLGLPRVTDASQLLVIVRNNPELLSDPRTYSPWALANR